MHAGSERPSPTAIALQSGATTMTIEPAAGARILSFCLGARNILLEASAVAGTDNANNFGATFWPSPQSAWGWPPPVEIDGGLYSVVTNTSTNITLRSSPARLLDGSSVSLTKSIAAVPERDAVDVTYVMTNCGESSARLAGWQIARVLAGGLTFFRLGEGGLSGDKLATVTLGGVQWYAYDPVVVVAQGQKTFADAAGWLAHVDGDLLLVQAFPDVAKGAAAEGEAEVELYADPSHTYVEIEPQGRVLDIPPGASAEPWTVRWWLRRLPVDLLVKPGSTELVAFVEDVIKS